MHDKVTEIVLRAALTVELLHQQFDADKATARALDRLARNDPDGKGRASRVTSREIVRARSRLQSHQSRILNRAMTRIRTMIELGEVPNPLPWEWVHFITAPMLPPAARATYLASFGADHPVPPGYGASVTGTQASPGDEGAKE